MNVKSINNILNVLVFIKEKQTNVLLLSILLKGMHNAKSNAIQYLSGLFFLMLPYSGVSQQNKEEGVLLQQVTNVEKLQPQNLTDIRGVLIKQDGIENQAFVQQVSWNYALIQQTGTSNLIFLNQSENIGKVNALQIGNGNQYKGAIAGESIETSILQQGDFNNISQNTVGSELVFEIIQNGNHNDVQTSVKGLSSSPIIIHQRGNDMRIIINTKN